MNTALEPTFSQAQVVVKNGGSLKEVQSALLGTTPAPVAEVPVPKAPDAVVLTDEVKKALRRLPEVFAEVQPVSRRALAMPEVEDVYAEYETLTAITDLLVTRKEALKEIVRNHMDVTAEEAGAAGEETLRDSKGHYILCAPKNPERARIPNTNQEFSREYRSGSISLNPRVLVEMLEEGTLSREAYLAMTREERVFDESKTMASLSSAKHADLRLEIMTAIQKMTTVGGPSTALFVRTAK
jgi:hypothetical protein